MSFEPDVQLLRRIKERLSKYLDCPYEAVTEVKQLIIYDLVRKHNIREDIAEDLVIRCLAYDNQDDELGYLWHLFNVGYFVEDTLNYKPNKGEEYETVNSNYLSTIECINSRMRSA